MHSRKILNKPNTLVSWRMGIKLSQNGPFAMFSWEALWTWRVSVNNSSPIFTWPRSIFSSNFFIMRSTNSLEREKRRRWKWRERGKKKSHLPRICPRGGHLHVHTGSHTTQLACVCVCVHSQDPTQVWWEGVLPTRTACAPPRFHCRNRTCKVTELSYKTVCS